MGDFGEHVVKQIGVIIGESVMLESKLCLLPVFEESNVAIVGK